MYYFVCFQNSMTRNETFYMCHVALSITIKLYVTEIDAVLRILNQFRCKIRHWKAIVIIFQTRYNTYIYKPILSTINLHLKCITYTSHVMK